MTNDISHQPNTIPWPPLIYLPGVALGFILNWLFPLPWITRPLSEILFAFGWLIAAGGVDTAEQYADFVNRFKRVGR